MSKPKKNTSGCLWIFIFGMMVFFGVAVLDAFLGLNILITITIVMTGAVYLTNRWLGKPSAKGIITNVVVVFLIIMILKFLGSLFENVVHELNPEISFVKEEGVTKEYIVENEDTVSVYASHRIWKDNYGNQFEASLPIRERDFNRLRNHIDSYSPSRGGNFWGKLYDYIDRTDTPSLDLVMKTFEEIHEEKLLNQMEFAEMVVSCIQDIPYSFVFQGDCLEPDNYEDSIRRILESCPECCIGNVAYGIQNPVSFLQNLKGDCDTRTVLIYSILKHFRYDVAILNSDFYRHSILGINLPAKGINKVYYGKKYVVWETTAKYFTVGELPTNFNDITHWNVVLTSK
ncbi:MAG: hypothetical protein HKN48_11915 [Flavobacteriaceae bacterium]|nr:hypothetical protein [Flavobacteriaceae bacterium]